jgi:hypothetical protein
MKIQFDDSPSIDAFGRLRVSQVSTQIDLKQHEDNLPLFINQVSSGNASASYSNVNSSTTMTTWGTNSYRLSQTYQRFSYQTGKSAQAFMTFSQFQPQENIIKRIGYFSSDYSAPYNTGFDGIFLESSNNEITFNVWKSGVMQQRIPQNEWNVDKLDGTGISGYSIDWSNANIYMLDYEWLGVGRIRGAIVINGLIYSFHHFNNANIVNSVYMTSPNQPFRWELRQTGASATTGSFEYICSTYGTEGSINTLGKVLSINDNGAALNANQTNSNYMAIAVRLKSTAKSYFIDLTSFNLLGTTNDNLLWEIRLNPTISGTKNFINIPNSNLEYVLGTNSNTVSGGLVLYSGFQYQATALNYELNNAIKLGKSIAGVSDIITLSVRPLSIGLDVHRAISWREQI